MPDKKGSGSVKTLIEKTTGEKSEKNVEEEKKRLRFNSKQTPLFIIDEGER